MRGVEPDRATVGQLSRCGPHRTTLRPRGPAQARREEESVGAGEARLSSEPGAKAGRSRENSEPRAHCPGVYWRIVSWSMPGPQARGQKVPWASVSVSLLHSE